MEIKDLILSAKDSGCWSEPSESIKGERIFPADNCCSVKDFMVLFM